MVKRSIAENILITSIFQFATCIACGKLKYILQCGYKERQGDRSSLFNEGMTYAEAQRRFFDASAGKDKDEKERIKSEYLTILPIITKKRTI